MGPDVSRLSFNRLFTMDANGDDIVISGIAGRYPECDSFEEFKQALLDGVDLITEDARRWEPGTLNVPTRAGKINGIEYFDAGYFGISPRLVRVMDPRHRVMFETGFEAIVDAGYNPKELRGSNTGVYIGIASFDNTEVLKELENTHGYTMLGGSLAQLANRASFCFDFRGPSFSMDTACSSGLYAFAHAVKAMENGEIDSALVSALSLNLHPQLSRELTTLNMLSSDGRCRVFCTDRDGYARSEAIVTVLLQKRSKCRRMYSRVLAADISCDGYKVEGITFPSSPIQQALFRSIYQKKNLNPDDVAFVEMHGTGTPAGDIIECESISQFFCQNRKEPLRIGAVKSNMGHSENSSGLCSLSKVIIAMETGVIPANLHCENIDYTLPGINTGKLKVITENLPWNGGMVSLNCFGFGGANAHLVLKSNDQCKLKPRKLTHRLVNVSGRTEESVKHYLDGVQKHQDDQEFLALIDEIHKMDVERHLYRGYAVLGDNPISEIKRVPGTKRPVWFIYSGMGGQWTGMGKDLMKIDIFRNTIKQCATALKPYGVDLESILTSDDPTVFDDISNCFSAIAATEVALTEVLKAFGITPDGFGGHSLGEVGCGYCNGHLTPEQATLLGFARGYATKKSKSPPGQMAAIGLSKAEVSKLLPENVYVACVNGSKSVTISGLKEPVVKFVASLNKSGIFAKLVPTAGYAFHSKFTDGAAIELLNFARKVVTDPKPRSYKWISSSRLKDEWNDPDAQLNSANYHYNNYRSVVLFDQVISHIPKNAIIIEVAPHGLLTPLLKKEMGPDVTCLSLASKYSKDNVQFLLSNIGQLFINGRQPNLRTFYDDIKLPVGRGTPSVGPLVKWDHGTKWFTPFFEPNRGFGKKVTVNTSLDEYSYLKGHKIDGRIIMAATGYLELVWKVVADVNAKRIEKLPVVFESVKFSRITVLPEEQDVIFIVNIMKQTGYFEVFEGGSVCCAGTIKLPKKIEEEFLNPEIPKANVTSYKPLDRDDIYKWFHLKRYMYSGIFQGLEMIDVNGTEGKLRWNGKFTSFLDTMLQVTLVPEYKDELRLPIRIQKCVIDPVWHLKEVSSSDNEIALYHDKDLKLIKSGGIEITNLEVSLAPKRQRVQADPVLERYVFVPYITDNSPDRTNTALSLKIALQIVAENNRSTRILRVHEIVTSKEHSLIKTLDAISKTEPTINLDFVDEKSHKVDMIVFPDDHFDKNNLQILNSDGFVLFYGFEKTLADLGLPIVYQNSFKAQGVYLLRNVIPNKKYTVIDVNTSDFTWMEKIKVAIKEQQTVYLRNQNDDSSGILGLVKCLNTEPTEKASLKCIVINGDQDKWLRQHKDVLEKQLSKGLNVNVLTNSVWGSYRHLPVDDMNSIDASNACNYMQTIGDLSSFRWVERPRTYQKTSSNAEYVYVHYAALNFKDVMIATGKIPPNDDLDPSGPEVVVGLEYSGITQAGKRVMGIGSSCLSLQTVADPHFTWEIPAIWSLEDGATVPVVYATCYYGLIMRAQMQKGESILIHAGAGGVGIAAISIALSMNCEVYTTVSSKERQEFLLKLFPKLKPENIGHSRNTSFEQNVMRNTSGAGVDVVLNSLSADLFQASIHCVAENGRFVEIGKVDLWAGTPISSNLFSKNTSFHGVFLDNLFTPNSNPAVKQEITSLVSEGIAKGVVRPLPTTVFTEDQVEDAYRFLSTSKHKGKVLIKIRDEYSDRPLQRTIKSLPRMYFDPEKTYVLIGGLGGIGLELTHFLIRRCARNIVLNSRRGITNGYQSLCMKKWNETAGVKVQINTDDSSTLKGAQSLITFAEKLGPVGGVFHMGLVLQDGLFINQTAETFESVLRPKIYSGLHIDQITRSQCPKLDHFVVLSSMTSGRGNAGQTNYAMANSALENLCEKRQQDGLPGLAVQLGPVGEVGHVAQTENYEKTFSIFGLAPQKIASCINALETFMLLPYAVGSMFVVDEEKGSSSGSKKSPVETIAHILGIKNAGSLDENQSLVEMGLDSLMSAEIKQTLYRNYNIEIATEEIGELTFNKITQMSGNADYSTQALQEVPIIASKINGPRVESFNAMLPEDVVVEVINDKSYPNKVFFIHPIEGNVHIMLPLAEKLKANVFGLQCTKDINCDNMEEYAKHFVKEIKNIQSKGPYLVCGYSFGGCLGFEIGIQLEKMNEEVTLFLIDGTPSLVKRFLEEKYNKLGKSEAQSKSGCLKSFLETFEDVDIEKISAMLDVSMALEDHLIMVGDFLEANTSYDAEHALISAKWYVNRSAAGFYYHPTVFRGKATLIRSDGVYREMSEDYDLQKICAQPIHLETLKGNHREILLGDNLQNVATLINNHFYCNTYT